MEQHSSQATSVAKIPWPGPKPYEEFHWRQFLGRGEVMDHLLGRVRVAKITVLLGESGSGKTSLIRAGVVPLLRQERYHPNGPRSAWPVFLLREGGAKRESTVGVTWFQQLKSAVWAIEKWGRKLGQEDEAHRDFDFFRSIIERRGGDPLAQSGFVGLIEEMAWEEARRAKSTEREPGFDRDSGLILVFDQFEEQLRSGAASQGEAFRLIRDIVESSAPTKILLSMRKEFRIDLRELENMIGELGRNSIYLNRLQSPSVVEIIEGVSNVADISIDKNVAKRIVGWLAPANHSAVGERLGEKEGVVAGKADASESGAELPDLLKLQAVLVELCRWAVRNGEQRIRRNLFERFVLELGGVGEKGARGSRVELVEGGKVSEISLVSEERLTEEEQLGQRVLGGALERWIESAISGEFLSSDEDDLGPEASPALTSNSYKELSKLEPDQLSLQVRRIAVRLAPLLSSADYKVAQEENSLFQQARGDEIAKLGLQDTRRLSKIEILEDPEQDELHLDWQALGELGKGVDEEKWEILCGPARKPGKDGKSIWTLEETGDRILACFKESLVRMSKANILRKNQVNYAGQRRIYWELVHDQFGPNLIRWAERQRGTWEDCKSSLVVCRGIQPLAVPTEEVCPKKGEAYYEVDRISWQGCGVQQAWGDKLTLRNVRFTDCYLVGTIFDGIAFVGCSFENCRMKGSLFRDCSFQLTRFDRCDANIAIVGGSISDLEFRNCHLLQSTIDGALLTGEIRYTQGSRVIQGYFDLKRGARKIRIVFDNESRAALCLAGRKSWALLKFDNQYLDLRNSALVDDFKVRF